MKIVKEIKKKIFKFYFLNTDFSFTILNLHMKLEEYLNNVLPERSVSHFVHLGCCSIFMT